MIIMKDKQTEGWMHLIRHMPRNVGKTQQTITALMELVERDHFRTVDDTGANGCAMLVWNALRKHAGLPPLGKEDLRQWDGKKYVLPENSRLIQNLKK